LLNEGWAAYWHKQLSDRESAQAIEVIDYADHNAGVLAAAPGQFNPSRWTTLLRHIEERWDKGRW